MEDHSAHSAFSASPTDTLDLALSANTSRRDSSGPSTSAPPSPAASTFLRTAATLEGISRQLEGLRDEVAGAENEEARSCCGASSGCPTWRERDRMEDKLKLSAEIGDALLQRYEALEKKYQTEVVRYKEQLEAKRTALAESVRRVNNLEKANTTHLTRYAEVVKKNEALEKRYTQALHTQTLTQQSLTHVRAELTNLRAKAQRHASRSSNFDMEDKVYEAEKKYEEMRQSYEAQLRVSNEEQRKRARAESRVKELENQLSARHNEVEEIKEARANDARELLANAKERLTILHNELSETFRADSPEDEPEYQKTLEDLVASNALLKHDASELTHLLNESREQVRALRDQVDDLRTAVGVAGRMSPETLPSSRRLASELLRSHARTESSPNVGNASDRAAWARMSMHIPSSSRMWEREHARKASLAPSLGSNSSYAGNEGNPSSPGLGFGPVGEYGGGVLVNDVGMTSPQLDGRESPKPMYRSSPNGGIGYVLNGVPKSKTTLPRPPVRRSISENRPRPIRTYSPSNPDVIPEWGLDDATANHEAASAPLEEPQSPAGSEYFRLSEASRKRRSIILSSVSTREGGEYSPNMSHTLVDQSMGGELMSPMSDGAMSPRDGKRVHRRTLLLLTKSIGTQTDPVAESASTNRGVGVGTEAETQQGDVSFYQSVTASSQTNAEGSETSSLHDGRVQPGSGVLSVLIDHLTKLMSKLRSADIPNLNRRLKRQHLPGDVAHLSRSTLRALQQDVAELRSSFKGVLDIPVINRRELVMLLKLFKDVFGELIELQAQINDVTIDPSMAKKLQREAFRDEDAEEAKAKAGGGLGWIAAPITKFFVTPAQEQDGEAVKEGQRAGAHARGDKAKLQPSTMRAPKLQASTSATNTHVSVEFGGAGIVRRATPAVAPPGGGVVDVLPPSPDPTGETTMHQATQNRGDTLAPPVVRSATLRPQKSRANRNELLGIFAGANPGGRPISPTGGGPWTIVSSSQPSGVSPIPPRQLRATSSQYFGDKTTRGRDEGPLRKKLSAAVDAVIDRTADQIEESDPTTAGSFEPPLLERTLRPRGLSDSSIRSTFINHDNDPPGGGSGGSGWAPSYGVSIGVSRGYLGNFASRFYPFKSNAPESTSDAATETEDADDAAPAEIAAVPTGEGLSVNVQVPSPTRPIAASPRSGTSGELPIGVSPRSGSVPMGQGKSLLGMLASSITAAVDVDREDESEDELREARLRRGMQGGTSVKKGWR